jgi:SAM-dependent methyltransferase
MIEAYREDLAFIHDAGFGGFARAAARVLRDDLRRRGIAGGLVADLGCGSGILAGELADAGYDVLGVDLSPAILDLARRRVPAGRFEVGSLLDVELPPCVAIAMIGECVNYLFDEHATWERLTRLWERAFEALAPGGPLLFDVAGPGRVPPPGTSRTWFEGEGWAVLVAAEEDLRREILTRRITTFRSVGALYRRDVEFHTLRLWPRDRVAEQLRQIGFEVEVLDGYGPVPLLPGLVGFLARKPGPPEQGAR